MEKSEKPKSIFVRLLFIQVLVVLVIATAFSTCANNALKDEFAYCESMGKPVDALEFGNGPREYTCLFQDGTRLPIPEERPLPTPNGDQDNAS